MKKSYLVLSIIASVFFLTACRVSINKDFCLNDGETTYGSKNTINGNIHVGENTEAQGDFRSVNGSIDVGARSRVRDLATVNGNIRVGREALVRGDIQLINGHVHCEPGVKVTGCIETINGKIILDQTSVEEDLSTYNGNMELSDNTIISGNIVINEKHGTNPYHHNLKIEIDNSTVEGDIINKDPDTGVTVYLTNGGKVKGRIADAKVIER